MKLDATDVRYLTPEEFRVLTAVEMGSKNHEVVPTPLIAQISSLRHAGISKLLGNLLKRRLIARVQNNAYDGFMLRYGGYDYLAVRALSKRKSVYAVGHQFGIGKESDIYMVSTEEGECRVLKIHRLGRISFRNIKEKRDYMGKRKSASWMYMSRLAAEKEYAFMRILYDHGFPVPTPIDQTRHTVLMSYENAYPLRQIASLPMEQVRHLYSALMALIVRLARAGLIHGDFNEFNLLIREIHQDHEDENEEEASSEKIVEPVSEEKDAVPENAVVEHGKGFTRIVQVEQENDGGEDDEEVDDSDSSAQSIELSEGVEVEPVLIDFPQMVSIEHPNAREFFERDVECVRRFFRRRFRFESDEYPTFDEVMETMKTDKTERLDALTRASGFGKGSENEDLLASHFNQMRVDEDGNGEREEGDSLDEESGTDETEESADEDVENDAGKASHRKPAHTMDASYIASRTAASRAHAERRKFKHHGRKSQATKAGRRHGGGKAKHNKAHIVADNMTF